MIQKCRRNGAVMDRYTPRWAIRSPVPSTFLKPSSGSSLPDGRLRELAVGDLTPKTLGLTQTTEPIAGNVKALANSRVRGPGHWVQSDLQAIQ